jgi:hypothetical protein
MYMVIMMVFTEVVVTRDIHTHYELITLSQYANPSTIQNITSELVHTTQLLICIQQKSRSSRVKMLRISLYRPCRPTGL